VAAAQRPVCGDECFERLLACHALKTPGTQDFVRSLVTKYLAARWLPVIVGAGRTGVYTECEPSREPVMLNLAPSSQRLDVGVARLSRCARPVRR
jgi:hypothetical protein